MFQAIIFRRRTICFGVCFLTILKFKNVIDVVSPTEFSTSHHSLLLVEDSYAIYDLPVLHVLTGCDTTSRIATKKGTLQAVRLDFIQKV